MSDVICLCVQAKRVKPYDRSDYAKANFEKKTRKCKFLDYAYSTRTISRFTCLFLYHRALLDNIEKSEIQRLKV